jgi:hypothetical protein
VLALSVHHHIIAPYHSDEPDCQVAPAVILAVRGSDLETLETMLDVRVLAPRRGA